jgi:predicted ArsR family transcriptional regulator
LVKETYHPNAYLSGIKNVAQGLRTRTRILDILEVHLADAASNIGKEVGMHYSVVMHHLRLLEKEGLVERKNGKPITWRLTGSGQRRLTGST